MGRRAPRVLIPPPTDSERTPRLADPASAGSAPADPALIDPVLIDRAQDAPRRTRAQSHEHVETDERAQAHRGARAAQADGAVGVRARADADPTGRANPFAEPSDLISGPISRGWSPARDRPGAGAQSARDDVESAWSYWGRSVDHFTIGACLVLFAVGAVLAFASSPPLAARNGVEPFYYAWRQLAFGAPSFALLVLLSALNPAGVRRFGVFLCFAGLIALALLPIYGQSFGKEATRWFSIAGASFQPSELAKPGVIIASAWLLCTLTQPDPKLARAGAAASALIAGAAVSLLVIQPDYGQAALIVAAWSAMYFVVGGSIWALVAVGAAVLGVGAAAYFLEPHIAARVDSFLDPAGGGQTQLQRAAEAVVNGGWFGAGLGEGVASARLPDAHSDFIFAVAIEEFGLAFGLALIAVYALIPLRAMLRLRNVSDPFAYVAGVGLVALFGLQALIHIAVTARLAPATGMTLPFVSYGGSSLLAMGVTVGLLIALTRSR